jgi:predicted nucleic acid-binding Zn ribbon protein
MKKEVKKESLEEVSLMQGIDFKSNRARMREQIKRAKKEQRKEAILFWVVAVAIIVMVCMLLSKMSCEAKKSCTSIGHSESYCEERI